MWFNICFEIWLGDFIQDLIFALRIHIFRRLDLKFATDIRFEICPSLLELQPNPSLEKKLAGHHTPTSLIHYTPGHQSPYDTLFVNFVALYILHDRLCRTVLMLSGWPYRVVQKSGHPYCFSGVPFFGPPCRSRGQYDSLCSVLRPSQIGPLHSPLNVCFCLASLIVLAPAQYSYRGLIAVISLPLSLCCTDNLVQLW